MNISFINNPQKRVSIKTKGVILMMTALALSALILTSTSVRKEREKLKLRLTHIQNNIIKTERKTKQLPIRMLKQLSQNYNSYMIQKRILSSFYSITRLTPKDTALSKITISGIKAVISGYTHNPSEIIQYCKMLQQTTSLNTISIKKIHTTKNLSFFSLESTLPGAKSNVKRT